MTGGVQACAICGRLSRVLVQQLIGPQASVGPICLGCGYETEPDNLEGLFWLARMYLDQKGDQLAAGQRDWLQELLDFTEAAARVN